MEHTRRREITEAAILLLLAAVLNSGALALRTQEHLSDKIVRLHVTAHSDAPADQAVKARVRDAVLDLAGEILEGTRDRAGAEARLRDALPELRQTAMAVLAENGCDYPATAELRETEFPTRDYGSFSLPAGRYLALRVTLGQGAGRNWWCVVFPPLCTAPALSGPAETDGFSAGEIRLLTEETAAYTLKFRTVELWESIRQAFFS